MSRIATPHELRSRITQLRSDIDTRRKEIVKLERPQSRPQKAALNPARHPIFEAPQSSSSTSRGCYSCVAEAAESSSSIAPSSNSRTEVATTRRPPTSRSFSSSSPGCPFYAYPTSASMAAHIGPSSDHDTNRRNSSSSIPATRPVMLLDQRNRRKQLHL